MKALFWMGLMTLALVACEEKKTTEGGEATSTAAPVAAAPEKMSEEDLDSADIPVEEDFEEEAREEITADNLESEVSKLEADITSDE